MKKLFVFSCLLGILVLLFPATVSSQSIDDIQFGKDYSGEIREEVIPRPEKVESEFVDPVQHPDIPTVENSLPWEITVGLGVKNTVDFFLDPVRDLGEKAKDVGHDIGEKLGFTNEKPEENNISAGKNILKFLFPPLRLVDIHGFNIPEFDFSIPEINIPKLDLSLLDIKFPKIHWPEINVKVPSFESYESISFKDILLGMFMPPGSIGNLHLHEGEEDIWSNVPTPPPQEKGDGSGPWNVESISLEGIKNQIFYSFVASAGDWKEHTVAARNLRHFLYNSGKPIEIDPVDIARDIPEFEYRTSSDFRNAYLAAVNKKILSKSLAEEHSFKFKEIEELIDSETKDLRWATFEYDKEDYPTWWWAINSFSYTFDGEVAVSPKDNGEIEVSVKYKMYIFDRYNWDEGKGFYLLGRHREDEDLRILHRHGLAREYNVYGATEEKTYTYILNRSTQEGIY